MKMKYFLPFIAWLLAPMAAVPQEVLTLSECYKKAIAATPLAGEKDAYINISSLKEKNIIKNWLPSLDASGTFVYNSSVVDLSSTLESLPFPGIADAIKPLPHEQYKLNIEINQVIYDGGAVRSAKAFEKTDLQINLKQNETDLYKLRSQINGYYFNLLFLSKQKDLLDNYLALINKRIASMQSALANGVILRTDIDVLTSEKIKLEQQLAENKIRQLSLLKILSALIGTEIDQSAVLTLPNENSELTTEISRPELQLFDLRKEQLDAGLHAVESKRMPKAFGFANLGYGNPPGNNFFKDEFAPYYILGAGVKWNIFDWDRAKNEKKVIALQKNIIENRKTDLTDNLKRMLDAKNAEIMSLKSLTETDSELISLRKRISAAAESQYENGTITATEYLNELNSEKQAVINHEIHKISLALAMVEYLNISGKEID